MGTKSWDYDDKAKLGDMRGNEIEGRLVASGNLEFEHSCSTLASSFFAQGVFDPGEDFPNSFVALRDKFLPNYEVSFLHNGKWIQQRCVVQLPTGERTFHIKIGYKADNILSS